MKWPKKLTEAWANTTPATEVHLLAFKYADSVKIHIEAPWDQDPEYQDREAKAPPFKAEPADEFDMPAWEGVLRLFLSRKQADFYLETVCCYLDQDPEDCEVVSMPLQEVFGQSNDLEQACRAEHEAPLRIDLSEQSVGEFPRTVDTLYSRRAELH